MAEHAQPPLIGRPTYGALYDENKALLEKVATLGNQNARLLAENAELRAWKAEVMSFPPEEDEPGTDSPTSEPKEAQP